jgi:signal transduction histidine kinase
LRISHESPVVQQVKRTSEQQFLWLAASAVMLFLLVSASLTQWINVPLRLLKTSLTKQKIEPLQQLQQDRSEFGDLARIVCNFFQQREHLLREMQKRRQTEEALHESEEQLRHSQKMEAIGRLAGGIAHDFNNLLTAIIGYADLLSARLQDPSSAQYAELIGKAGEQAAGLTRQLLAFSRKQILQPRVVDLNELVGDMQKLLQRVIGEHIQLHVETAADPARVMADPTQLEQVILNLGVNARDAMPRGGTLTIRTKNIERLAKDGVDLPPGRYLTLTVSDTGCGIDEQTKQRIFEPFFTTKEAGKGTGLGLATVYGIVRQSGGCISVDSTPGEGSHFTIYLPEEAAPLELETQALAPIARSRGAETLLVVEDEEIVRELVCAVLERSGLQRALRGEWQERLAAARRSHRVDRSSHHGRHHARHERAGVSRNSFRRDIPRRVCSSSPAIRTMTSPTTECCPGRSISSRSRSHPRRSAARCRRCSTGALQS